MAKSRPWQKDFFNNMQNPDWTENVNSSEMDLTCRSIYRIGGFSCFLLLFYSFATILIVAIIGGPPATIEECYSMLHANKLAGLLRLDLLTVFIMPLYYLVFYSIYAAMRMQKRAFIQISTLLVFAGVTLFLATPSVFSYLHLSNKYAAATSDLQREHLLAAGEAILSSDMWHGTGAQIGGLLLQSGAMLISFAMWKGGIFNRLTALTGIVTHGLDLAHIIIGFMLPSVGVFLMFIAGPLYLLWFPLIGVRLFKLAQINKKDV